MSLPETAVTAGLLIADSVWDIRKREILLLPTLLVLAGGVIVNCLAGEVAGMTGNGSWILALLPGLVLLLMSAATLGKIGFGDGLAVCAAGVWCGMGSILLILFLALLAVPVAAGLLWIRKRPARELPFIPFLLFGFCLERILFWNSIW